MKTLTQWLVRKLIPGYRDVDNVKVRARYGSLEAWTSILGNLILFAIKLALGLTVQSVAIVADAIHTLSDTGTSIVILIGFKIAKRPSDREHPFGHGRMEYIATLIVSVLLIVAGFELFKTALGKIFNPSIENTKVTWTVGLILAGTIVIKEIMARFARELATMIKSKTLEADFWHHRSDVYSTILVLAAMVLSYFGYLYVDGIAGLGVALIVMYAGYAIAREAISPLLGEKPDAKILDEIKSTAMQVPGVLGVHDVIVHRYGQVNLVSLHIEVSDAEPIAKLHDTSELVEEKIENKLGGSAVVHIDPLSKTHPRYQEIHDLIEEIIEPNGQILSFHDLRINDEDQKIIVSFDITVNPSADEQQIAVIKQQLCSQITEKIPQAKVAIKPEPPYAYTR